ncbi:MAG: hypothetical protein KatS3mg076_0873 [Candidatus Binatia bacterium]|nr:MAG: hypothetical protein KatS3mg076_0873 [Candidatus Binatia bacterium]
MTRFAQASLALLPLAALVVLAASIAQSPLRLCPDCGVNLEAGELFSEGKRPYVDFVPLNPPLVVYLNALPAYVAERFGAHPVVVLNVFFFFLVAWSTLTSRSLAREEKTRTFSPFGIVARSVVGRFFALALARPPLSGQRLRPT